MLKIITVGLAVMVIAAPAFAQERGTLEVGAFASRTSFGKGLVMDDGSGLGGRIGMFLSPSMSIEFEGGASHSGRPSGLAGVNSSVLSGRLTAMPLTIGRVSLLVGAGVDHTDTHFIESYGMHGLVGAKVSLMDNMDARLDGILSHMSHGDHLNKVLHLGISTYFSPNPRTTTITKTVPGPMISGPSVAQLPDSVSAEETRRLRVTEVRYRDLRDSLRRPLSVSPGEVSSAAALATMHEMIRFETNKFELSDSAKSILAAKVPIFKANPAMGIVITGFASQPGTETYNYTLGRQRAEAAKAYLVSLGVAPQRIEVSTKGEGQLLLEGPSDFADATNRRDQFRLLIADPFLVGPKKP